MAKKNSSGSSRRSGKDLSVYEEEFVKYLSSAHNVQPRKMEALGQLAGGVAHDFNNILMIIDGLSRMLGDVREDDEQFEACIRRMRKTIQRGTGLTRKLLTFGRHNVVDDHVIELGRFLRDQEQLLRPLVSEAIDLHIETDEALFVQGMEDELSQIVINLVSNARDAFPTERGTIAIAAYHADSEFLPSSITVEDRARSYICLRVVDSGRGMSAATMERLFEPFFSTKDQGKGTGLGLSVVYGIVRRMDGHIDVRSTLGQGTMIRIYFPLAEEDDSEVREPVEFPADAGKSILQNRTVLLVEDEDELRDIMHSTLQQKGMKVIAACNGNDALLKQHEYDGKIDFLLTDIVMPELDGIRLSELLREIRPEMKPIFMSGYPERNVPVDGNLPEEALFLAKPVEFDQLMAFMIQTGARHGRAAHWRVAMER